MSACIISAICYHSRLFILDDLVAYRLVIQHCIKRLLKCNLHHYFADEIVDDGIPW
jgi:hypothetical protein